MFLQQQQVIITGEQHIGFRLFAEGEQAVIGGIPGNGFDAGGGGMQFGAQLLEAPQDVRVNDDAEDWYPGVSPSVRVALPYRSE